MNEVEKLRQLFQEGVPVAVLARECHCAPLTIRTYMSGTALPSGSKQVAIHEGLDKWLMRLREIIEEEL